MNLDENSAIPLYYQLENIIRRRIENGIYKIDDKIPSERSLSEEFALSRMTVSKAVNSLVDAGILYRKRGQGTFVSKKKVEFFPGLKGFVEIMKEKGLTPSSKVVNQEIIKPNKTIPKKLQISENEKIIVTERLRLADDEIIALEKSYVPYSLCSELLKVDLSKESIYKYLTIEGYKPTKVVQEIQATLADEEMSKLLQIEVGAPILKRERVTFSKEIPIEFSLNFYKGDRYSMTITTEN